MSIDWEAIAAAGGIGKGTPLADAKEQRARLREKIDETETVKVKTRSGGRCEIVWEMKVTAVRCDNRAVHIHHMIGGWGKRARGESVLAIRKQHACPRCHDLITSHRLRRLGGEVPHYTDIYARVK